jgi:cytochrome c biogenesis protein
MRSFFSSVKLTLALLILLALSAVLGTVIPQQEAAETFAGRLNPGMLSLFHKLQLFDIFHSPLFMILTGLLSINLVVCSLNRLPVSWRRFRERPDPEETGVFLNLPPEQVISGEGPAEDEAARAENILKKSYKDVRRRDADGDVVLAGGKGNASHLGVYVIHFSVLLILAGMMIGYFFGFDAYVSVAEGESADTVQLKSGKGAKKLDFAVRCDRFTVEHYDDGMPKTYRSDLTFTRDGQAFHQASVLVNHPAEVEGIRFYQASYGTASGGDALLVIGKGKDRTNVLRIGAGREFDLPGKEGRAKIIRVEENLMRMGPAVKMQIRSAGKEVQFWVFQNIGEMEAAHPGLTKQVPMFNPGLFAPYVFSLVTIQPRFYTGLQVSRDPGVPLVIGGSFLLVAGFMTVFFYSHRRVWIGITSEGGRTKIRIAGRSNRDRVGLNRDISRLIYEIGKKEA